MGPAGKGMARMARCRILFGKLKGQVDDYRPDPWASRFLFLLSGMVPFLCDEMLMPSQNHVRCKQGTDFIERLAA